MIDIHDPRLQLCAITDDLRDGVAGLVARAVAAERGGATMVQLRLKHADARTQVEVGRALVSALAIPVIVNERLTWHSPVARLACISRQQACR